MSITNREILQHAASILQHGGIVVYPTETFFGIGCRYDDEKAIARVFQCKRRLLTMPLPLIISDQQQLEHIVAMEDAIREDVADLAKRFWPGALTLILPARRHLSLLLTGGTGNVALRVSPHPVAHELAQLTGVPIVSSSANISGQSAVTSAANLSHEFRNGIDFILDLPPIPAGGKASTIIKPLGNKKLILHREGTLTKELFMNSGYTVSYLTE